MRIGTAEADSTFRAQGEALATLLRASGVPGPIEVALTPAGSINNAQALDAGAIDYGYMAANWIGRARRGEPPFTAPIDLAMVAPMNAGPLFLVVRADSDLRSVSDLVGRRVSPGMATSGMTQHARTIISALGLSLDAGDVRHLDFAAGAQALERGLIDAQLQCPIPNAVMTSLDDRVALRVLDYAPGQLETVLAAVPFYRRVTMRQGALRALTADSAQPGVVNVLVTHARAEPAGVARVTAAIVAGMAALEGACGLYDGMAALFEPMSSQGAAALEFGSVPLHEGAADAYRAAGYLS